MHQFRYIYVSDGTRGFLLDRIEEFDRTQLRLLSCTAGSCTIARAESPIDVRRAGSKREALSGSAPSLGETSATSQIPGIEYEIRFALEGESHGFGPAWGAALMPSVPDFHSRYGRLTQASVLGVSFGDLPLGYSWYSVKNLAEARWILISALEFEGTDLRLELAGVRILNSWMGTVVFRYRGVTHRLNGIRHARRVHVSEDAAGPNARRTFTAQVSTGKLELEIEARAPLAAFVLLERHGTTEIETTLFGDCEVRVRTRGAGDAVTHRAAGNCLLELKR